MSRLSDGKKIFNLKPDILFSIKARGVALIADAKYKHISSSFKNYGVSQADIYQMLAYTSRFLLKKSILIYPQGRDASPVEQLFKFEGHDILLKIATINIHQSIKDPANLINECSHLFDNLLIRSGD